MFLVTMDSDRRCRRCCLAAPMAVEMAETAYVGNSGRDRGTLIEEVGARRRKWQERGLVGLNCSGAGQELLRIHSTFDKQ